MGSDIYRYIVVEIDGTVAIIEYYSGQSQSLAPHSGDDTLGDTSYRAHWVGALCEPDSAWTRFRAGRREGSCPLTMDSVWRQPTGDVIVKGLTSLADGEALLRQVNDAAPNLEPLRCAGRGASTTGGVVTCNFSLNSVADAQRLVTHVNERGFGGAAAASAAPVPPTRRTAPSKDDAIRAARLETGRPAAPPAPVTATSGPTQVEGYFKNVRDGPEFIMRYDSYPDSVFGGFVTSVELLNVQYDCLETAEAWEAAGVEENYWNTKARYRVEVTNASFLSHLSVGASWDGR